MKTVLLKLSGPLQAWGTNSHFETRNTDAYPSKSGVIGMIAAGLGYDRNEDDKLKRLNSIGFAVRIDQEGQVLRDYHTAKKHKNNGELERTYVTNRYYLQDAVFVVALSSNDDELIKDVRQAVTHPYYPLYLGRRSLPPTADLLLDIVETDAVSALKNYPWQASDRYRRRKDNRKIEIFADKGLSDNWKSESIRYDTAVSFSQTRGRRFASRQEVRIIVDAVAQDMPEEHDAFGAIGEE